MSMEREVLQEAIINTLTGEITFRTLTDTEYLELEKEKNARMQEQQEIIDRFKEKIAARSSAIQKLQNIGLTEAEVNAIIGGI